MFALVKCALLVCAAVAASAFELGDMDVMFHLFTKNNPTVSQPLLSTPTSIMQSSFSPSLETVITIHNFGESVSGNFNAFVVPALLEAQDINLLAVDWSVGSTMYTQGLGNAIQCGERIATMINLLHSHFGYQPSAIRLVGVGLGAHIAGIAASKTEGEIPHITALDPSLHGWTHHPNILHAENAAIVEVLYTTAGLMGYDKPLGDVNFYANGGSVQTNCGSDVPCSHTMSYVYYAESLNSEGSRFVGTKCESYDQAVTLQCADSSDIVFGGLEDKTGQSGIYTFRTNFQPPFAQG